MKIKIQVVIALLIDLDWNAKYEFCRDNTNYLPIVMEI